MSFHNLFILQKNFRRKIRWKTTCIFYLNGVIINGNTYCACLSLPGSVSQCIHTTLSQSSIWYLKLILTFNAFYLSTQRKMFEEKGHCSIHQFIDVAFCLNIV